MLLKLVEICKPLKYNSFTFYVPFFYFFKVCGSMPFDDSNVKKMIKDQLERKLLFSKSKKVSAECKDLIRKILEGNVQIRANLSIINSHHWVRSPDISNGIETSGSTDRCKTTEAGTSTKTAEAEATLKTTEPTATLKTTAESEPTLKTTAESEPTLKTTEAEATLKTTAAEATLKTTEAEATLKTTEAEATLKTTEAEATLKMSEAEALLKQQKQKK
jgi:serine kinase